VALDPATLNRATAWLVRLAAVAFAALVVTGLPLAVLYGPDDVEWLSGLHALASTLFLGAAAAMALVALAGALMRHRPWAGWVLPAAALAVAAVGAFTGPLLAWDALGLEAVMLADFRGVLDPLGGDVRFVIVGDTEVSQGTYLTWLLVHVIAVPVGAVAVGLPLWRRLRATGPDLTQRKRVVQAEVAVPDGPVESDPASGNPDTAG
jgi:quinol-cytochrome oxidoreductase complex cytochrome b subunit